MPAAECNESYKRSHYRKQQQQWLNNDFVNHFLVSREIGNWLSDHQSTDWMVYLDESSYTIQSKRPIVKTSHSQNVPYSKRPQSKCPLFETKRPRRSKRPKSKRTDVNELM